MKKYQAVVIIEAETYVEAIEDLRTISHVKTIKVIK